MPPEQHWCWFVGCGEPASFRMGSEDNNEWLCFGHWQTTPYAQSLMAETHKGVMGYDDFTD